MDNPQNNLDYTVDDFKALLAYVNQLAGHKLGYPVSLLTYMGMVNNDVLGIDAGSLANVLLNNVGDPFKDSETSLLEVKRHERAVINILVRYYGLQENEAKGYVTTGGTEGNFAALWWSKRYLINSLLEPLIALDDTIKQHTNEEHRLNAALAKISTKDASTRLGILEKIIESKNIVLEKKNIAQQLLTPTVFYTRLHTHYSIPKIAEILRLNIREVAPLEDGAMDMHDFRKELLLHVSAHPHSPIIAVANIGTTITGAIDAVPEMNRLIESLPNKPPFTIHMDGALTGFVLPILKPFGEVKNYFSGIGANTLAVSAHKYPGVSQPCGIVLAQAKFFEKAFEKGERNVEYVGNIVDVTITGSRSGLNVLMFYNALISLGMDKNNDKLTAQVQQNLTNAKYLYDRLVELYGKDRVHDPHNFNVSFPRPPQHLARKYQLMLSGGNATICVLANVTAALIDEFIMDLKKHQEETMDRSNDQTTEMQNKNYSIQTLTYDHVKQAADIFTKSFCDSEPITKHLNIRYHDYEIFARDVVQKAAKDGLSKVALDKNGKVIACVICEDLADPFVPHLAHYPKLTPIVALLEQVSEPFMHDHEFMRGKVAHIWISIVDNNHRGQGLSTDVGLACSENAARKGFDFAYMEFTNEISEKVMSKSKSLKLVNRIKFEDFTSSNGDKPFRGLTGSAASYIAAIRPGINFDSLSNCYKVVEKY